MTDPIHVKTYDLPAVDFREVLRYAGCRQQDQEVENIAHWAADTAAALLRPAVCWRELPVSVTGETITLGEMVLTSRALARNLRGCERAVLFGATVGLGLDRQIARYGRLSPAKGLLLQALGAERIEALCDVFNAEVTACCGPTRPRFSPGYGDLPLETQRQIFPLLDCAGKIGLYLNESLLMSPTKSVTAIIGIGAGERQREKCAACGKKDCTFRREK